MDALIRAMPVSGEAVTLTLRRRGAAQGAGPGTRGGPPALDVVRPGVAEADAAGAEPGLYARPAIAAEDPRWREQERERLRAELEREFQARIIEAENEARLRGHAQGLAAAEAAAERELAQKAASVDAVLAAVRDRLGGELAGAEDLLVGIAFEAICRILGESLVKPEGVRAVVRQALVRVRDETRVVVRVAPSDHALLLAVAPELAQPAGGERRVDLVPDDRVALGGCLIETDGGNLDARLETQLGQLRDLLRAARQAPAE